MKSALPNRADPLSLAKDRLFAWKSREVMDYAAAFVSAGIEALRSGRAYFSSEDVSDEDQPASPQVSGAATSMLLNAHVVESYYGHHPEIGIVHGRKRSARESRNGAKINLYQIATLKAAETFLSRYQPERKPIQEELILA